MPKLVLLRHLLSQWNEENRFNGWIDTPLAEGQEQTAKILAEKLFSLNLDKIYCSRLFRNMDTLARIFEHDKKYPIFVHLEDWKMQRWGKFQDLSPDDVLVYVTDKLNERYYGELQGENKEEAMKKYGEDEIRLWRRSWNVAPPGGESLKDVYKRAVPFFKKYIERDLKEGKNVLVVASHNPLRAVIKYVEKISDKDIVNVEVAYAGLRQYGFENGIYKK